MEKNRARFKDYIYSKLNPRNEMLINFTILVSLKMANRPGQTSKEGSYMSVLVQCPHVLCRGACHALSKKNNLINLFLKFFLRAPTKLSAYFSSKLYTFWGPYAFFQI